MMYAELAGNRENCRIKSRQDNRNRYQEFGTIRHGAQPFLRPALKKLERVVVIRTAKAYNDALYSVF